MHARRYSQITHPCLMPPLGGNPPEFLDETYAAKTRGIGLWWKLHAPKFNRFRLIHPCDGRTDRRTDGRAIAYSALSMLSRAKNVCIKETDLLALDPMTNSVSSFSLSGSHWINNTHYTVSKEHGLSSSIPLPRPTSRTYWPIHICKFCPRVRPE